MTRNQKIALGCGGAGCLGLIVVGIASCAIYFLVYRQPARRASRDYTFNVNVSNENSNSNSNLNSNENANANENENSNSSTSVSSMSDDDKHKLFQAATVTGDGELLRRVEVKLGLVNEDFTPGQDFQKFLGDHIGWGAR